MWCSGPEYLGWAHHGRESCYMKDEKEYGDFDVGREIELMIGIDLYTK
jgi:hypothetical protein